MPAITCPTREELTAFVHATSDVERSSQIAEHVDSCSECEAIVTGLESSPDAVVSCLKSPPADELYLAEPECGQALAAIAKWKGHPAATAASGNSRGAVDEVPVNRRIRDYQLLKPLGAGGMGLVYLAVHMQLEKVVAIKLLRDGSLSDSQAVARFQREMKAVGRLDHPQIVRAFDAGAEDGTHFLAMEYVDGIDLGTLVARLGPLPIADASEIVRQAACALQHVHEHHLVHRDVKPSNLMLAFPSAEAQTGGEDSRLADGRTRIPTVKLLDLGLALLQHTNRDEGEMTGTGDVMGTADYVAPEQAESSHAVDIRADIYSLGCTLYKLITGDAPFGGAEFDTPVKKAVAHIRKQPVAVSTRRPDVPPSLAKVVERMLAKSPAARYATPAEVATALEPFATGCNLRAIASRAREKADSLEGSPSMGSTDVGRTSPDSDTDRFRKANPTVPTVANAGIPKPSVSEPSVETSSRRRFSNGTGLLIGCASAMVLFGLWSFAEHNRSQGPVQKADLPATKRLPTAASQEVTVAEPVVGSARKNEGTSAGKVIEPIVAAAQQPQAEGQATQTNNASAENDTAQKANEVYPTAVFMFDERGTGVTGLGTKVSDFLNASLAANPDLYIVDRADLRKILDEQEINLSGLANANERVKLGHLTGAKILVSGSVSALDKTLLLVARLTGTENGRIVAVKVTGKTSDDLSVLVQKLADEVEATIRSRSGELVVKATPKRDRIAAIRRTVANKQLPKVWIHVTEGHIGQAAEPVVEAELTTVVIRGTSVRVRRTIDPAAETEIALLCKEAGFVIIDPKEGNRKEADVLIEGEAFSEFAGRHGNLVSVKARVEIAAVNRQTGERLFSDRQTEIVVDLAEQIAGKTALQNAAAEIAERMLPKLAQPAK